MILVHPDGVLIHANRSGLALLRKGPGLRLQRGVVVCRDSNLAPAFSAALLSVATDGRPRAV